MKAEIVRKEVVINLQMTYEEAILLQSVMLNPLTEHEAKDVTSLRENIFNAIDLLKRSV